MNNKKLILRLLIVTIPVMIICLFVYKQVEQLQYNTYGEKPILINEVMTDNLSVVSNEKGAYVDWIEIYNPSSETIELKNFYLSDSKNELTKWNFPDVNLLPDEYLIVFCDNDISADNKYIHTNFMLNSDNETVYLSDFAGNIIDEIKLESQECNVSYGRLYGSADKVGFLPYSTVGYANPSTFSQQKEEFAEWGDVIFSHEGGIYKDTIEVSLSYADSEAVIFYTLDGSEPDISSNIYKGPITITNESTPNQYTNKKCIANTNEFNNLEVEYGVDEVYKGTVIRARVLKDGKLSSTIQTNTYFINPNYSLPIVSLTVNPNDLFDEKDGNYVLGYTYYTLQKYQVASNSGNYFIPKDLSGYIEIYDNQECVLKDEIEFSLAGASSLSSNLQKSFNVILDSEKINGTVLGAGLEYEYSQFSLRGSGGGVSPDKLYAYPSSFITNYLQAVDIGAQSSRFCILFINGEYWGIYTLMEPKGKEYISNHCSTEKKDISIVAPYVYNTTDEFDELYDMISVRTFDNSADYDWIKGKININNFMQFIFAEAYFGNTDGLKAGDHNYYIWKEKNGLWNWQAYDFDSTMVDDENYFACMIDFEYADVEGEEKKNFSVWLFQKLWNCSEFRRDFYDMAIDNCKNIYSSDKLIEAFQEHVAIMSSEMNENLLRCQMDYSPLWKMSFAIRGIEADYDNYDMNDWEQTVGEVTRFLENRTNRVLTFIDEINQ